MFVTKFNRKEAEYLKSVGFTAKAISEFTGASLPWVHSLKTKVDLVKQQEVMKRLVEELPND